MPIPANRLFVLCHFQHLLSRDSPDTENLLLMHINMMTLDCAGLDGRWHRNGLLLEDHKLQHDRGSEQEQQVAQQRLEHGANRVGGCREEGCQTGGIKIEDLTLSDAQKDRCKSCQQGKCPQVAVDLVKISLCLRRPLGHQVDVQACITKSAVGPSTVKSACSIRRRPSGFREDLFAGNTDAQGQNRPGCPTFGFMCFRA